MSRVSPNGDPRAGSCPAVSTHHPLGQHVCGLTAGGGVRADSGAREWGRGSQTHSWCYTAFISLISPNLLAKADPRHHFTRECFSIRLTDTESWKIITLGLLACLAKLTTVSECLRVPSLCSDPASQTWLCWPPSSMPLCTRVSCARLCLWAAMEHFGEQSVVLRVLECLSHPGPGCVFVIMQEASEIVLMWTPPRSLSAAMWKAVYTCCQLPAPLLQHPERPVLTCVQRGCGPHPHLVAGAGPCSCVMGVGPPVRAPMDGTVVRPCCRRVHVCLGQRSRSIVFCREGGACVLRGLRSVVAAGTSPLMPGT